MKRLLLSTWLSLSLLLIYSCDRPVTNSDGQLVSTTPITKIAKALGVQGVILKVNGVTTPFPTGGAPLDVNIGDKLTLEVQLNPNSLTDKVNYAFRLGRGVSATQGQCSYHSDILDWSLLSTSPEYTVVAADRNSGGCTSITVGVRDADLSDDDALYGDIRIDLKLNVLDLVLDKTEITINGSTSTLTNNSTKTLNIGDVVSLQGFLEANPPSTVEYAFRVERGCSGSTTTTDIANWGSSDTSPNYTISSADRLNCTKFHMGIRDGDTSDDSAQYGDIQVSFNITAIDLVLSNVKLLVNGIITTIPANGALDLNVGDKISLEPTIEGDAPSGIQYAYRISRGCTGAVLTDLADWGTTAKSPDYTITSTDHGSDCTQLIMGIRDNDTSDDDASFGDIKYTFTYQAIDLALDSVKLLVNGQITSLPAQGQKLNVNVGDKISLEPAIKPNAPSTVEYAFRLNRGGAYVSNIADWTTTAKSPDYTVTSADHTTGGTSISIGIRDGDQSDDSTLYGDIQFDLEFQAHDLVLGTVNLLVNDVSTALPANNGTLTVQEGDRISLMPTLQPNPPSTVEYAFRLNRPDCDTFISNIADWTTTATSPDYTVVAADTTACISVGIRDGDTSDDDTSYGDIRFNLNIAKPVKPALASVKISVNGVEVTPPAQGSKLDVKIGDRITIEPTLEDNGATGVEYKYGFHKNCGFTSIISDWSALASNANYTLPEAARTNCTSIFLGIRDGDTTGDDARYGDAQFELPLNILNDNSIKPTALNLLVDGVKQTGPGPYTVYFGQTVSISAAFDDATVRTKFSIFKNCAYDRTLQDWSTTQSQTTAYTAVAGDAGECTSINIWARDNTDTLATPQDRDYQKGFLLNLTTAPIE